MAEEGVAQLKQSTVGVHREAGRDEAGAPRVEKVPRRRGEVFLSPAGNEEHHALHCHRIPTEESWERYGRQQKNSLVSRGFIPKRECPYAVKEVLGGAMAKPPKGKDACKGDPDGCEHYASVREMRRKAAQDKASARRRRRSQLTPGQAKSIMQGMMDFASQVSSSQEAEKEALRKNAAE